MPYAGTEAQCSEHDASPAAPPAAPTARVLRSRKGHADAAPAKSAQGSAASKQFPSPPKTRAGRKRNQAAAKSATLSASTRTGLRAAHLQTEAADDSGVARQQEEQVCQQSLDIEATSLQEPPHSGDVKGAHITDAVLATAGSLQEVQVGPNSHLNQDERLCAGAPADPPTAPVVASSKLISGEQIQAPELAAASTSQRRKRKQSAVGESLVASDSKRWHSNIARLGQSDSPVAGSTATEREQGAKMQTASDAHDSESESQGQQQELLTLADSMDASSPPATDQPEQLPVVDRQPSAPSVPGRSPASAADAVVDIAVAASPVDARNSDYQDAQERLSSPLHVSPDPARSEREQPAEPSVTMLHEDVHQATAAASPGVSDNPEDQAEAAEVSIHVPVALNMAEASPVHVAPVPEPDASVQAARAVDASSAAIAGVEVPDADSITVLQANTASALGTAAAVPLPSIAGTQGEYSVYAIKHMPNNHSWCCRL